MINRISSILMCILMLFSMVACSLTGVGDHRKGTTNSYSFEVDKVLLENEKALLECKAITTEGIEFECHNKTNEDINIHLTIALDGTVASLWSEVNETTVVAGENKNFYLHGDIALTKHKLMSVYGILFIDSGNVTFELCDVELGGSENKEKLPTGQEVYSSDNLLVEYIGADAQGVKFKVINNREASINFGAESFKINGEDEDYSGTVITVPGHSKSIYRVDILSYNEKYFSNELVSFEGIMHSIIAGNPVERFSVSFKASE